HTLFIESSSKLNDKSESNLRKVIYYINKFYRDNPNYHPNLYWVAYMLGTARLEAYDWKTKVYFCTRPEIGSVSYFNKYENRKDLGNNQKGDGYKFRGRGLVQLTGRTNYTRASTQLDKNFLTNPDLVL